MNQEEASALAREIATRLAKCAPEPIREDVESYVHAGVMEGWAAEAKWRRARVVRLESLRRTIDILRSEWQA